ncbi:hypothetical protein VTO73DRAFT_13714 [Trametes versicolor]
MIRRARVTLEVTPSQNGARTLRVAETQRLNPISVRDDLPGVASEQSAAALRKCELSAQEMKTGPPPDWVG